MQATKHDSSPFPLLTTRNNNIANITIRKLAKNRKALIEPTISHALSQVIQIIADTITRGICTDPCRIFEALARVDAVCKAVHPDNDRTLGKS